MVLLKQTRYFFYCTALIASSDAPRRLPAPYMTYLGSDYRNRNILATIHAVYLLHYMHVSIWKRQETT